MMLAKVPTVVTEAAAWIGAMVVIVSGLTLIFTRKPFKWLGRKLVSVHKSVCGGRRRTVHDVRDAGCCLDRRSRFGDCHSGRAHRRFCRCGGSGPHGS